ncbi:MAG: hypothetical protein KIT20_07910 [Alphaproteobacteria bacterium]|nr:hypothetical protein [Alphaproteobacteria bacterium]
MIRSLFPSILVAGLLCLAGTAAPAMEGDGRLLHRNCRAEAPAEQRACLAALSRQMERIGESDRVCLPNGYEIGQIRAALLAWAEDHPDELGLSLPALVRRVLEDEFPCSD